ncbi:MAG TPA: AMP-binding protein [Bacteroidales bacterium]|nr:AMP-binding protein [Bacteroidales bacterium]
MYNEQKKLTFPSVFQETLKNFSSRTAYSFAGEASETYDQIDARIKSLISFLEKNGIVPGNRVAILSHNMPEWPVAYFSITFMGAVAVPVLPDFSPTEIKNVLEHSGSRAVFVSSTLVQKLDGYRPDGLMIISIEDFSVISDVRGITSYNPDSRPGMVYSVEEEDLASIIYTSGTTGRSKGVMLTHKNIVFNAMKGAVIQPIDENDRFLSVLPLSHTYENTLGLILPLLAGASVHYLRKPPTPSVLLPALEKVRPTMMLTVPLIIEKIYFNKIIPSVRENKIVSTLYKISFFRKKINAAAGKKLMKTFGAQLKFFGIGGAKLNKAVEKFLIEAKFPYAIGYGLTETAPLLAGSNPKHTVFESTGPAIEGVELKIHEPDSKTGEGEIWAKGPNVMKGYYKEPELTKEVLTADGWFRTGDLGVLDADNNLFIKGRLKNMILGASGENIYPEEIESIINNFRFVVESLVLEQKGKLVALVHLNMEELEKKYQTLKDDMAGKKEELVNELKAYVNSHLSKFSQVQKVIIHPEPFQKTATLKIKRFLYA